MSCLCFLHGGLPSTSGRGDLEGLLYSSLSLALKHGTGSGGCGGAGSSVTYLNIAMMIMMLVGQVRCFTTARAGEVFPYR